MTNIIGTWIGKWGSPSGATYEYIYKFTDDGHYYFSDTGVNTIYNLEAGVASGYQAGGGQAGTFSFEEPHFLMLVSAGSSQQTLNIDVSGNEMKIGNVWYSRA